MTKKDLEKQAQEILEKAEKYGAEQNFFFITTFERYKVQISVLAKLEAEIKKGETLVEKEYVKGRKNLYTSPAVTEYNKTADSANKTVVTLMKIIGSMCSGSEESQDELMQFITARKEKKASG